MRKYPTFFRLGVRIFAMLLFVFGCALQAETTTDLPKEKPAPTASPAELAESFRQLQEQLRAAEQAIAANRLEAEASANARNAALNEKLDTLRQAVLTDRERLQYEAQRSTYERLHQQAMTQDLIRIVLVIGGAGLLALIAIAVLHWRGNRRLAEYAEQRLALPGRGPSESLAIAHSEPAAPRVVQANERLIAVLDRMEKRVLELEQTAAPVASPVSGVLDHRSKVSPKPTPALSPRQSAHLSGLLEQGQSFLNAKKPVEALACLDEVLSLKANHAEALLKKGTALERLQKNDAALQYYDRAIDADPNLTLAYIAKGGLCVRLERLDEALACYEQAMRVGKLAKPPGGIPRAAVPADLLASR